MWGYFRLAYVDRSSIPILACLGHYKMSPRLEMKIPSGDGIANITFLPFRSHTSEEVWTFHNTNQVRSKQLSHFYYKIQAVAFSLNFIMSLHLTSGMHEIFYISVFTSWKEIQEIWEPVLPPFTDPCAETTKTCSSEDIFWGQSSSLQRFLKQVVVPC